MKNVLNLCVVTCLTVGVSNAAQVDLLLTCKDGRTEKRSVTLVPDARDRMTLTVSRHELPADLVSLEVQADFASARTGEEGYFVFPNGQLGAFREQDGIRRLGSSCMPMYGMKTPRMTFAAVVTGMPYNYSLVARAVKGVYTLAPVFDKGMEKPYEDIVICFTPLTGKDADYAGMAKVYRTYQLERGACVPLRERVKSHPELAYAVKYPEVRIRQGWKPVPSPVPDQTVKNEPPMKVVVTFDRVGDIAAEFKRQGVEGAQLCLVGWNQKGHDGRWPQIFPVEESLGGEAKLREAIRKCQDLGYQIVAHCNHLNAYLIADCWDAEYVLKNADGTLPSAGVTWGGGRMYNICARRAYERFAAKDIPMVAALGFRGLHYLDVYTCVAPLPCSDPRHPLNERQYAFYTDQVMQLSKKTFGGISSEGPYDFCCGNLDYVLYVSFAKPHGKLPKMVDRLIPIWQLVYNGVILSTPFTTTVNYTIQDRLSQLKLIEFNGRPVFYFYSQFKDDGKHWMGDNDLCCASDEELRKSVAAIKKGQDEYAALSHLQFEFMEQHEQLAPEVFRTVFSDGSALVTNYSKEPFTLKDAVVPPLDYKLIKPENRAN